MTIFFSKAVALARDSRISLLPTLVILCLLAGEQYPFSFFPMYSSFSDSGYYVYLTNSLDRPIATQTKLGVSTTTLKNVYDAQLRKDARSLKKSTRELTPTEKAAAGHYIRPNTVSTRVPACSKPTNSTDSPAVRPYQSDVFRGCSDSFRFNSHGEERAEKQNGGAPKLRVSEAFAEKPRR